MMKPYITLAATAGVLIASAAQAGTDHRFTRDGSTYVFTETDRGSAKILSGRIQSTGETFHLIVRDGRVFGDVAGRPVSFRVPSGDAAAPTTVASR